MDPKPHPYRHPRRRLALLLASLCASPAFAAETPAVTENPLPPPFDQIVAQAQIEAERFFVLGDGFDMAAGGELGSERVVKGAPYCADAVHESVQWLPDGQGGAPNRIVRQQSTRLCRDGEGRTRQEVERGGRKIVYLRDPAARESWVLDPERKTARRLGLMTDVRLRAPDTDSPAWREYGERMREFGRQMAERARNGTMGTAPTPPVPPLPPLPPLPPQPVIVSPSDPGASGAPRSEVRVLRMNRDGESAAEWALPPMAIQWRAGNLAPRGAGSVSPLGAKDVEGVRANGERTSWVIEAGKLGNEKPIQITREVWTSPELMLTVASRDFDPRSGETNYRLKNLKRGEPDAALMRVPADFSKPTRPSPRASGAAG